MKKYLFLFLFLFLMSCAAGNKVMNEDTFTSFSIGMTESELRDKAGSPYSKKDLGAGEVEYEYIERVIVNNRTFEVKHYYFIIKNGQVTSKKIIQKQEDHHPLLEQNAYDLQTTYR